MKENKNKQLNDEMLKQVSAGVEIVDSGVLTSYLCPRCNEQWASYVTFSPANKYSGRTIEITCLGCGAKVGGIDHGSSATIFPGIGGFPFDITKS